VHPESARELKARLSSRLSRATGGVAARAVAGNDTGATRWSGVALGLAPVGPKSVHLAIRLVDQADAEVVLTGLDDAARSEVDVRVIGQVRRLGVASHTPDDVSPDGLRQRVRPLRPGLSVGHPDVTAGTLGGFVRRPGSTRLLVLSNSHVLAVSGAAQEGDPLLQPGVADGGTDADRIGSLTAFVPLTAAPGNLVAAAVAALDDGVAADPAGYPGGALGTVVAPLDDVDPDDVVEKVGRTTGHTRGRITAVEVDGVGVRYDDGLHTFDDQVEVEGLRGGFSAGGDSGSIVWRSHDRAPLGLLFAGSETGGGSGGGVTFCNPLANVLSALGVQWLTGPTASRGS
jgi:hypothetical protein